MGNMKRTVTCSKCEIVIPVDELEFFDLSERDLDTFEGEFVKVAICPKCRTYINEPSNRPTTFTEQEIADSLKATGYPNLSRPPVLYANGVELVRKSYYSLITAEGEDEAIVYYYYNPDAASFGFGFNVADGGGFLPLNDLMKDTVVKSLIFMERPDLSDIKFNDTRIINPLDLSMHTMGVSPEEFPPLSTGWKIMLAVLGIVCCLWLWRALTGGGVV